MKRRSISMRLSQTGKPISTSFTSGNPPSLSVRRRSIIRADMPLLHREMAEAETRPDRKAELLQIASICEHVPENPARTFQEALQSMAIVGVCKNYEHPMHNNPQWGRGDQYLYPYFIRDINSGAITLERAAELLAELIGRWGTQTFVASESTQGIASDQFRNQ